VNVFEATINLKPLLPAQCVEFKPQRHSRFNGNTFNLVGRYGMSIGPWEGLYQHMAKENRVNLRMHPFFLLVEKYLLIFGS